jgi:hypothetical protein
VGRQPPIGESGRRAAMTPILSREQWPDAMAGAITLLEIALGPEITEEAFAVVMGRDTFVAACRRADFKARRGDNPELQRHRALLHDDLSLHATWSAIQKNRSTAEVTVEAIKQAVREVGADALEEISIRLKLRSCDHTALAGLDSWLLKRGVPK